jgi:tetratricopeptide (TPR) repeat protein
MELLERESSLASLAQYAAEARSGDGRLVLVSGEAGVGKTALIERLARDLPEARWYWGACDGLFTPRPLAPLYDLADQLGGPLADLSGAGAEREALFRALLRQVSEPGLLTVVVVEDVHWADEATIDLLRFTGRRLRAAGVLLVVTYRDDDLATDHPLRIALGELARHRSTRRVGLAPLSEQAVRALATGSRLEPSALFQLTGGNPFYVTEVLQAAMDEVPASARDAVLARAAGLTSESREVLDVAALTGTRVELWLLEAAADCPAPVTDELLGCGLLAADGDCLRFRHEIARLAVEQAIPAHRRSAIHRRLLAAALGGGSAADETRLAYHAEGAADVAAVLCYAPSAARRAAGLASHREAAAQFQRALRFAGEADPATAAALYDELAEELRLLDRVSEAAEACGQARELWRQSGNRLREGDTTRRLSTIMRHLCRGADSEEAAVAAVAMLEPLPASIELARAYANLAAQRMLTGRSEAAVELARPAQSIAGRVGAPSVISDALNTEGVAACDLDRDWVELLNRALQIALAEHLPSEAGRAYCNFYALYCGQRRFAEAAPYYADGVAYCDEHDLANFGTFLRSQRTGELEKTGRWEEALAMSRDLLEHAAPSPNIRLCPQNRIGTILTRQGEPAGWESLAEAMAAADGTGEPQQIVPSGWPALRRSGWKEDLPRLPARPSEPMTTRPSAIRGSEARWRSGCGAPDLPVPLLTARSPSLASTCSAGTGRKLRGSGPTWAAVTKPR